MTLPRVLVTDGHLRSSLAVVRSLGRAGYSVFVCSPRERSLAGGSRYAQEETRVPDALSRPTEYSAAVRDLAAKWKIDFLLPMSEESLLVLLPAADQMAGTQIPFAPVETFRKAADKAAVTAIAASLGIAVPDQIVLTDRASAPEALRALKFPVVVKPSRSVSGEEGARVKNGVEYANTRSGLDSILDALPASAFPVLVQRRIDGSGTGVFVMLWDGKLVAQFAHRRIREKPPSGGVSVCSESIPADPAAVEGSRALLSALGWNGPAMVEFKQDRVTGERYLMEINGRFWGSLQLAIDAGVDFPALLLSYARGERPAPVESYQVGVITRWWWGEVDHLIARLKGRGDTRRLGSRSAAVMRFLWPERGARNEVLRASDPRPFVRETLDWFQGR